MTDLRTVAALFHKEPTQWGLRGDPYLWREMRAHFEQTAWPATADELAALIESTFEARTGHSLAESQAFFVERFSHGGMSSGYVSPEFWREQVIPLMRARYAED